MSSVFEEIKETEEQLRRVDSDIKNMFRKASENLQIPCYITLCQMSQFKYDTLRSLSILCKMANDHNLE